MFGAAKFVRDEAEFQKLKQLAQECFQLEHRLPDQVFRPEYRRFFFREGNDLLSEGGWEIIQELAHFSNDHEIMVGTLGPDQTINYFSRAGYYSWMILPVEMSKEEYIDLLWFEPQEGVSSIRFSIGVLIVIPRSKSWAIWVDVAFEFGILGITQGFVNANLVDKLAGWVNARCAAEWWIRPPDSQIKEARRAQLIGNYL